MPVSMHRASVPVFRQMLSALSDILDKAVAFAAQQKITDTSLLAARLYPNMLPFARQVQLATDHAKGAAARLAGREVPSFPDEETTLADLKERLARTIAFIEGIEPAAFDGAESRTVALKSGGQDVTMKGDDYLFQRAYPNFFFHVTTAYDILRHLGADLGKSDFVGRTG